MELTQWPIPEPGPRGAVVRRTVALAAACAETAPGAAAVPDPRMDGLVGTVHAVGRAVRGFSEGERVAACAVRPCHECGSCRAGEPARCAEPVGGAAGDGALVLAEHVRVDHAEANLAGVPDEVTDEQAACCGGVVLAGLGAAERARVPLGGIVAVFGRGALGLTALVGARLLGAGLLLAVQQGRRGQDLAMAYGADVVLDPRELEPVQALLAITGRARADAAIHAMGCRNALAACLEAARPGATVSRIGHGSPASHRVAEHAPIRQETDGRFLVEGVCPGERSRLERLLRLVAGGRVDPAPLIARRVAFRRAAEALGQTGGPEGEGLLARIDFG